MCVSTSPYFPLHCLLCVWVIEKAEAKLVPLHSTPGKGQCRAEPQFGGAPEVPRHQGAISPVAGLVRESTPFLRRTPVLTLGALTPFYRLKKCGTFPGFFWKRAFQGNTQDQQILFTEIATVSFSCRGQGRKGQTLFACLFHTPGKKQVPICLLEFYFMAYLL